MTVCRWHRIFLFGKLLDRMDILYRNALWTVTNNAEPRSMIYETQTKKKGL